MRTFADVVPGARTDIRLDNGDELAAMAVARRLAARLSKNGRKAVLLAEADFMRDLAKGFADHGHVLSAFQYEQAANALYNLADEEAA